MADGRIAVAEGIELGRRRDQRYFEAELLRLDALFLDAAGERAAAVDAVGAAIELADAQGSIWLAERARETLRTLEAG